MQFVLSNSLAALMLVHSLLGCCWYRAHEKGEALIMVVTTDACCSHDSHSDRDPSAPCKHQDNGCCPGGCIYLSSARPQLSKTLTLASLDHVVALPALNQASHQFDSWERAAAEPALGPPVRLHLLHQILLI